MRKIFFRTRNSTHLVQWSIGPREKERDFLRDLHSNDLGKEKEIASDLGIQLTWFDGPLVHGKEKEICLEL